MQVTQPMVIVAQPPVQCTPDDSFKPGAASQVFGLSVTQIIMGCFCIILGVTSLSMDVNTKQGPGISVVGYGIWMGVIFIIIGILGISASKNKSSCMTTAVLILNIIFSCIGSVTFVSLTSVALIITSGNECQLEYYQTRVWREPDTYYDWGSYRYVTVTGHYETQYKSRENCNEDNLTSAFYAFDSLMLIMALIEFVINIWTAGLCCGALCRCCKQNTVSPVVRFISQPQQIVVQPAYTVSTYNANSYAPPNYSTVYPSTFPPLYPNVPNSYTNSYTAPHQYGYPTPQQYPVGVHAPTQSQPLAPHLPPTPLAPPSATAGASQPAAAAPSATDVENNKNNVALKPIRPPTYSSLRR